MAVFGKPKSVTCTCYEIGHTWTPSCLYASVDVAFVVFKQALKVYGTLYTVAGILKKRDLKYFKEKILKEIAQSVLFLTTNGTLFISFFCIWRQLTGYYSSYCTFLCGIPACALSVSVERADRRGLLAIYMANVATETAYRMVLSRGWIKPVKHGEVLLFSVASAIYLYFFRKGRLPDQTKSALSFLVGKEELPITEKREEPTPRRHGNRLLNQLTQNETFQRINTSLQSTPKHWLCQHSYGCVHYVVKSFVKMFGLGFLVQGGVKLLGALPRMHKNPKAILHALIHQDNFRLGAFLGCFSAIFKTVNCLLRWLRNKDSETYGLLGGFLAGWSMLWYKSSTIALYTAYKLAEVLYFKGITRGFLPYIRCADIIIYSLSTAFVFHVAVLEPHNLRPAYWSFLLKVTGNRFSMMNRKLLEPLYKDAAKIAPDYWPDYDMRYTSLTRDTVLHKS
ncbi:transmembrane protein 135-like isoform X2 [Ostrea edulis]|uniref:transmembrane protein 135-like isoform X2 n=1 Tax=Ostrea edulis TaxID=37623 RepID=UPI0024AEAD2C|nr:transmembrane protein 135-like isoform X2 [Ostrea edulis]